MRWKGIVVYLLTLAWAVASVAREPVFPDDVRVDRDVAYLGPDRRHRADLYFPQQTAEGGRPACVIIHGGGFNGGHKDSQREIVIGSTLARHGYVGMSIDYQLWSKGVKKPTWPRCLHDAKLAVRWLRQNADRLGVDPDRIGVIGGSAGGNLAAMLGVTGPGDGLEPSEQAAGPSTAVQCVVDLYGVVDLMHHHDMRMFLATRDEDPESYRRASPVNYCSSGDAPVLLIHGTADETVALSQSESFARALQAAGVEHELIVVPNAPHSFGLDDPRYDIKAPLMAFLDRHLGSAR